jgi:hypothetical protein
MVRRSQRQSQRQSGDTSRGKLQGKLRGGGFTVNVAPGVTVTAKRRAPSALSNEASYYKARSALLASEKRALQSTLASSVIDFMSKQTASPETDAREFALQQQLTEAKITAAGVPLLAKQVQDLASGLTQKERDWINLKNDVNTRFANVAKRYTVQRRQVRTANGIASLNAQLLAARDNLQNVGQQTKARLSDDIARLKERINDKRMELEKAIQAQRQAAVLQQELNALLQNKRAFTPSRSAPIAAARSAPRSPLRRSSRRPPPRRSPRRVSSGRASSGRVRSGRVRSGLASSGPVRKASVARRR